MRDRNLANRCANRLENLHRLARLDAEGEPVLDAAGRPVLLPTQYGMPDLAVGATWAVANYVFECQDPTIQRSCTCTEEGP